MIEGHRFITPFAQTVVDDIEHLQKRSFRRNIARVHILEAAPALSLRLPPDFEMEVHAYL